MGSCTSQNCWTTGSGRAGGSRSSASRHAGIPPYLVLGTLGSGTWRDGMNGGVTLAEFKHDMADIKAYMRVEITPQHWAVKDSPED